MIRNNEKQLPQQGYIDGKLVSNYHLLPKEILLQEGWIESIDIIPTYDEETQYLTYDEYEIIDGVANVKYLVMDKQPTQEEVLQDLVQLLADKGVIY